MQPDGPLRRIPLRISAGRLLLLEADEIFYLEARGGDTLVRTARKKRIRDARPLAEWEKLLLPHGFLRIHRSTVVNLNRVREVRRRGNDPNDWEVKLDPPVNAVLPVSRAGYRSLRKLLLL